MANTADMPMSRDELITIVRANGGDMDERRAEAIVEALLDAGVLLPAGREHPDTHNIVERIQREPTGYANRIRVQAAAEHIEAAMRILEA